MPSSRARVAIEPTARASKAATTIARKPPRGPVQRARFARWARVPSSSWLKVIDAPLRRARSSTSGRRSATGG
jgi:hypothetical protein